MTLKQQIKDAKLLLGLHPGCHIVCKRKKKAQVETKVMTSKEKPKGNEDEEALRKIERANYIIRTEKPRIFETEGKIKKIEKSEQEILKLVEDIIKKEVGVQKQILRNTEEPKINIENKILRDVETQTVEEIRKERTIEEELDELQRINREERENKEVKDIIKREIESLKKDVTEEDELDRRINELKKGQNYNIDKINRQLENTQIINDILINRIDEQEIDKKETKENLLILQNEIRQAEDELNLEGKNSRSHDASELRKLIKALKEEEHELLQEEILGPRSSSSSTQLDKFIGSGKIGSGMTDQELDHIMKDEPYYQNCISADEIDTLKPHKKMEFIINTDVKSGPGKHWCACYIDIDGEKEVDYYDPLADDPTERFRHDIQKYIIDELDPKTLLKFKINKVIDQRSDTDTCGLMCVNFLKKRNRGINFKKATGYEEPHINKTKQFEKEAMEIRRSAGFGYI